jgi:NitT/TauT family transport system permease protein
VTTRWPKAPSAEKLLSPYLIAQPGHSQWRPIAPLLVIWFGPGTGPRCLICGLTVFFPVLINTIVGLRAVPENLRDVMRSPRAHSPPNPAAVGNPRRPPVFFAGLRAWGPRFR